MIRKIAQSMRCLLVLLLFSFIALEIFFFLRIALMGVMPAESTAFERTAAVELLKEGELKVWQQEWVIYAEISESMKRAVIASEDSGFYAHNGIEWDAIMNAWTHNQKKASESVGKSSVRGGSTITQQLAKNLFLSSEQSYLRKVQELYLAVCLELFLSKEKILELYLNHAEWGKGVYGVQASAQHYFKADANAVNARNAATMAAMLPKPRYYENHQSERALRARADKVMRGMPLVKIP